MIDKLMENRKRAKERLSTLKLIYVQKFAQTQNLTFGSIRFSKNYKCSTYESLPCQSRDIGRIRPVHKGVESD